VGNLALLAADAVVTKLKASSLSLSTASAARMLYPLRKREQLSDLAISVVPGPRTRTPYKHNSTQKTLTVDIGVQQAVGDLNNPAATDALLDFMEEIETLLELYDLPTNPPAYWKSSETIDGAEAGYAPEMLNQLDVFTGILRLNYLVTE
jgi:hypothetical protein